MISKLGINIDHVATLRQTRKEYYPDLLEAVGVCGKGGADQITIHLREDRRHIQDKDVHAIRLATEKHRLSFNLEMGVSDEIARIAILNRPDWVCLVPENRQEMTTEGGLDLKDKDVLYRVDKISEYLKKFIKGLKISLFLESDLEVLEYACKLKDKIDAVEIHTEIILELLPVVIMKVI